MTDNNKPTNPSSNVKPPSLPIQNTRHGDINRVGKVSRNNISKKK